MALVSGFDPAPSGQQPVDNNGNPVPVGVWGDSNAGGGVFGTSGVLPQGASIPIDPPAGVEGHSADGPGVVGRSLTDNGVVGESLAAPGILARSTAASGLLGVTFSPTDDSHGVFGSSTTGGNGVTGFVGGAAGVIGSSIRGIGVHGTTGIGSGVLGESFGDGQGGAAGPGVRGNSAVSVGVLGFSGSTDGTRGMTIGEGYGVYGAHFSDDPGGGVSGISTTGTGVYGESLGGGRGGGAGPGVDGSSDVAVGVRGISGSKNGIDGVTFGLGHGVSGVHFSTQAGGGVSGLSVIGNGVEGFTFATTQQNPNVAAVRGQSANGYAGLFVGRVRVMGYLSKSGGGFTVDHPTDPENQYLSHSFVESPEMLNVYTGTVTTGKDGTARVELPSYFEALNRDFRYQLTVIGDFARAVVSEEIENNQFTLRTDAPAVKVCWQVTGVRKDAWAEANRIEAEHRKPETERGKYLHPELFDKKAAGIHPPPTGRLADALPEELRDLADSSDVGDRLDEGRRWLQERAAAGRARLEQRLPPDASKRSVQGRADAGRAKLDEQWRAVQETVERLRPGSVSG
jgi:hypothetical protein